MSEPIKNKNIINSDASFDVVGDILDTLRFHGTIFLRSELAAPWGLSLGEMKAPRFHIMLSGQCYLAIEDEQPSHINDMEIMMLPNGNSHWIADQPGRKLTPVKAAAEACELGSPLFQQGKITHKVLCGMVQFDEDTVHPILDSLPKSILFSSLKPTDPVWVTIQLIDAEASRRGTGNAVNNRLAEVLFLQLIDKYIDENKELFGFFSALHDKKMHHALKLIHKYPDVNWSLPLLGERTGMSTATLVRHFQKNLGIAPMKYVSNWRMIKTHQLVKYTATRFDIIADMVGFSSTQSLNKAFKRYYNYSLSDLRQGSKNKFIRLIESFKR